MSSADESRARLISFYEQKAETAEQRLAELRATLPTITDEAERKKAHYQLTRQTGIVAENRDKAARLRGST